MQQKRKLISPLPQASFTGGVIDCNCIDTYENMLFNITYYFYFINLDLFIKNSALA